MLNQFSRTELLIGKEGMNKLAASKVAIFGIGGVGSYTVEALARAGVGNFVLVDKDEISITNINRQIHATHNTVGQPKVNVMKERILSINPLANIETHCTFCMPENSEELINKSYSYIVDAVDTVTAKIDLVLKAKKYNIPIISAMGAANKLDPTKFEVADIYKTSVCPLAKVMRKELKTRDVEYLKVVYSKEEPIKIINENCFEEVLPAGKKQIPGSVSFVPSVMGLIIAGEVIKDLTSIG